jgi:putative membrane protein
MNLWWIIRTEFRRIFRSKIGRAAIAAGIVIPLLYSSLYLYAFWDPYNNMDKFPVALVNQDQGGVKDGQPVNYGKDLVDQVVKDRKFDWEVVSAAGAKAGLEGDKYYLMVTIPPSFSKDALSVTGDTPHRAELQFTPNEGKNYVASTISTRLETALREEVGNNFSKEYFNGIFNVIGDAGNGLSKAADGANQLANGARDLHTGTVQVHDGAVQLNTGAQQASSGAAQVADGNKQLAGKIVDVHNGIAQSEAGAVKLQTGANSIITGDQKLVSGLQSSSTGAHQLYQSLNGSLSGFDQLKGGLTTMQGVLGSLNAATPTTQDPSQMTAVQLLTLVQQKYHDPMIDGALQKVSGVSGHLGDAANQVDQSKTGLQKAVTGIGQIATGQDQLLNGAQTLTKANSSLAQGIDTLKNTALHPLNTGTATMVTKSSELASGAGQVADGNKKLADGSAQLASGSSQLVDGSQKLADGNTKLSGSLNDALKNNTVKNPDAKADIMADPVHVNHTAVHPVSTYGIGLASYFIPLALWVGAFMLYFILSMREYRWTVAPVSSTSIVLGKFLTLGTIGVVQAVVASLVLTKGLGLTVLHPVEFYFFNILFSLTSIAIVGLLIARLGSGPGRFLAIVLLILQLTSSAGTFPLELVPSFFKAIHPFLPMTYGVEGLRSIIAIGDQSVVRTDALILACVLVVVLLLQIVTTRRTIKVSDLHEKDVLVG